MSVLASLFSGISGIVANGSALSVSGDNIANLNTMAFKSSNALFESNLTQRIGEVEVGLGSRLSATNTNFTQGAFASSSRNTDLAIQGEGFFVVQNANSERFYTRAGSFSQNASGQMVTTVGGLTLLANPIDADGLISGTPTAVDLSSVSSAPVASTAVSVSGNLDPNATIIAPGTQFDGSSFASAQSTSNFSVPATLYDSRGTAHEVITYFRRTGANAWEHYTLAKMDDLDPAAFTDGFANRSANPEDDTIVINSGTASFNTDGTLNAVAFNDQTGANVGNSAGNPWNDDDGDGTLNLAGNLDLEPGEHLNATSNIPWIGATALAFNSSAVDSFLDLGQVTGSNSVLTQVDTGNDSVVTEVSSDGRASGEIQSLEFTRDGFIRGVFSNGESRNLYAIPLAVFQSNEGLSRVGSNLYQATARSGDALLNQAGGNGRGEVVSFTIEQSNVDLATEFVKIIQFQRGFQASARTITASSDILAELVNLGR